MESVLPQDVLTLQQETDKRRQTGRTIFTPPGGNISRPWKFPWNFSSQVENRILMCEEKEKGSDAFAQ